MKHTGTLLLIVAFTLKSWVVSSQPSGSGIAGRITDVSQKAVAFATVSLLKASDSTWLRSSLSDSLGSFAFEAVPKGTYLLKVSAVGYKEHFSDPISIETSTNIIMADIKGLSFKGDELANVTIVGRRPPVEVHADKTVVNVEATLSNTGATALEVLEKSPGVMLDRDGNISLRGKPNPLVMIDGKPTYLSPADLVNLLNTMNANQLDQIELMTNPPAKYDAAGNAGVINIKTKKNKQRGFNGTANATYNQGRYASGNGSVNLNYRNGKFNVFGNYNYNLHNGFGDLTINRYYLGNDGTSIERNFEQPSYMRSKGDNNTVKLGIDYYLNPKTTIGITAGAFISPRDFKSKTIGYWSDADFVTDSSTQTISDNSNLWKNQNLNINLRHQFDKQTELTADLDYIRYDMVNNQLFTNSNFDEDNHITQADQIRGYLPAEINIWSAKADYAKSFQNSLKMEAGAKTSLVKTDNLASYENKLLPNGEWEPDYNISNHFFYEERIAAAYGNLKGTWKKFDWQAGLRLEHTDYEGYQAGNAVKPDSSFRNNYTSLFPTAFISYKVDSVNTLTVSTGRRINRPAYQQLNPFKFFINKYTYQEGNPYLQPEFTANIELTHSYKGIINTTIGYANTTQRFSQVFRPDGGTTVVSEANIGTRKVANLTLNINHQFAKWWNLSFTGTANYMVVDGENFGEKIESENLNGNFNINNQFKFNKGWSAELSGFYNTKSEDGQFKIEDFGQLSAGIGKQVLKGKGSIRLNARDIFWTQKIDGRIKYGNVRENFFQFRDSRQITLSVQYRFGKPAKDGERRRNNGGASDEQRRVGVS
ncbi:MAG: TonB-dependent receptor [Chitinophagaceae bacterium]|nr:TonB-dependent receptor [Chitinophagaceae bacterium]